MSSTMITRGFWAATAERAARTAAQTAIATIGTTAAIHQVDWVMVGSVTALATVLSVLTSVAACGTGNPGPALAGPETIEPEVVAPEYPSGHSTQPEAPHGESYDCDGSSESAATWGPLGPPVA